MLKTSLIYFFGYTISLGILYPALVAGVGQILLNKQANGSIITDGGVSVGSELIGQAFTQKKYFWGRPSATAPASYNPQSSSGSNMSLTNPALQKVFEERIVALENTESKVPVDLITASGSGLDPEISIAAAKFQARRVALSRGIDTDQLFKLIDRLASKRTFGILGEPRINVLILNIELDRL